MPKGAADEPPRMTDGELFEALYGLQEAIAFGPDRSRLTLWDREVELRREVERRHPVPTPADILRGTISAYHAFVGTAGQEHWSRSTRSYVARSVLAMQRAVTPATRDAADRKLTPPARRIWFSMQPEYDGRFDPIAMQAEINAARGEQTYAECLTTLTARRGGIG
jgi:hypothetical protein